MMTEAQDATVAKAVSSTMPDAGVANNGTDALRVDAPVQPGVGAMEVQVCKQCGQTKPLNEFYTTEHVNKQGVKVYYYRKVCKKCVDRATYERRKVRDRPSRARPREVSADDRTGKKYGAGTGAGLAGDYHFDVRFLRRLARIARVLQREGWRSLDALAGVDNQQLGAAGMQTGDVQILRKAQSRQDERMLRYILHEPIAAPPPVSFAPNGPRPVVSAGGAGEDASVAQAPIEAAPEGSVNLLDLTERAEHGLLSDRDIEAAAEILVAVRVRIAELGDAIQGYEDRLERLRGQLNDARNERIVAINLLRRV